jgi:hypothetical protein
MSRAGAFDGSQLRALNEAGQLAPESELREPQALKVTLAGK